MSALSGAGVLAQANGDEYQGHFIDRFIDTVTSPEAGDVIVDWLQVGIEWLVVAALFVVPALLIFGGVRARRYGMGAGGLIALLAVWWYRTLPQERIASGTRTFTGEDGETFECVNAKVDADGELLECGSGLASQIRQNSVLDQWSIPVGDWGEQTVRWVENNLEETLKVIEWPFARLLELIVDEWLVGMSWVVVCLLVGGVGWAMRGARVGILSAVALIICGLLGGEYWQETARTIGFIAVAVLLCVIVGIPIGVLCGRVDGAWTVVRPVMDAMQVVHSFVYMLPFIYFFGIGFVSATMVTMTFALPPLIRLTNLGIRQVPEDVVEAARAYGAPERRVLFDVQLPLARPAIMTGLNQTLLLAISMLGIAAIMGAGGLGRLLYQGIQNQDIALGVSGGLAFFLVAVVLDRISQTDADHSSLFSRIAKAWANRRTPEVLLEEAQAASDEKVSRLAEEPEAPAEEFVPASGRERASVIVTAIGALVMLVALLLPWSVDAGRVSSWARFADADLRTEQCEGQWIDAAQLDPTGEAAEAGLTCSGGISYLSNSFNGVSPSGGSWFGIFMAGLAVVVVYAAAMTLLRPGEGSSWLGAHGAVVFASGALGSVLGFFLANPPAGLTVHSTGFGVWVAAIGGLIAVGGAVSWLWRAPMTARRPLTARVGWGRMIGCGFALLLLVISGFSGWSFDTREESVIGGELQAELDAHAARQAEWARIEQLLRDLDGIEREYRKLEREAEREDVALQQLPDWQDWNASHQAFALDAGAALADETLSEHWKSRPDARERIEQGIEGLFESRTVDAQAMTPAAGQERSLGEDASLDSSALAEDYPVRCRRDFIVGDVLCWTEPAPSDRLPGDPVPQGTLNREVRFEAELTGRSASLDERDDSCVLEIIRRSDAGICGTATVPFSMLAGAGCMRPFWDDEEDRRQEAEAQWKELQLERQLLIEQQQIEWVQVMTWTR